MVVFSCNPESVPLLPVFNLSGIGCPGLWLSRPPRIRSRGVRALGGRWDGSEVCVFVCVIRVICVSPCVPGVFRLPRCLFTGTRRYRTGSVCAVRVSVPCVSGSPRCLFTGTVKILR